MPLKTRASRESIRRQLARATVPTEALMRSLIDSTFPRYPNVRQFAGFARLQSLVGAGAWLDSALALIDIQLPLWGMRHLYHEGDEWQCVLALRWAPADWLTKVVVAKHGALELAVMSAYLEAVEHAAELERPLSNVVPIPQRRSTRFRFIKDE